jgi:hypothetical protein
MKTITTKETLALLLVVLVALFGAVSFASANHSGTQEETESHATTVHDDTDHDDVTVTVAPIAVTISAQDDRTAKLQQLLSALQQLVTLLQHKLEHMDTASDDADDENSDDHHE